MAMEQTEIWQTNADKAFAAFLQSINTQLVQTAALKPRPIVLSYASSPDEISLAKIANQLSEYLSATGLQIILNPIDVAAPQDQIAALKHQLDQDPETQVVVLSTPAYAGLANQQDKLLHGILVDFGKGKKDNLLPLMCLGGFGVASQILPIHFLFRDYKAALQAFDGPDGGLPAFLDLFANLSGKNGLGLLPDLLNLERNEQIAARLAYEAIWNTLEVTLQKLTITYRLRTHLEESHQQHAFRAHLQSTVLPKLVQDTTIHVVQSLLTCPKLKTNLLLCQGQTPAETILMGLALERLLLPESVHVLNIDCADYPGKKANTCILHALRDLKLSKSEIALLQQQPVVILLKNYEQVGAYDNVCLKNQLADWPQVKVLVTCRASFFQDFFQTRDYVEYFLSDPTTAQLHNLQILSIEPFATKEAEVQSLQSLAAIDLPVVAPDAPNEAKEMKVLVEQKQSDQQPKQQAHYQELEGFLKNLNADLVQIGLLHAEVDKNPQIFISYAWAADPKALARQQSHLLNIAHHLTQLGFPAWLDIERMTGDIDTQMAANIEESRYVMMIGTPRYTERSQQNTNVKKEYEAILKAPQNASRKFPLTVFALQFAEDSETYKAFPALPADIAGIHDLRGIDDVGDYIRRITEGLLPQLLSSLGVHNQTLHARYQVHLANLHTRLQLIPAAHLIFDRNFADFQALDIEERLKLYIPGKGLLRPEYAPDQGFELHTNFAAFLEKSVVKTYAILGQGGSGKSLFVLSVFRNILQDLITYRHSCTLQKAPRWLPIYISLKSYAGDRAHRAIQLALQEYHLDEQDIEALKTGMGCHQKILFILDGYDELGSGIRPNYTQFLADWPYAKLLISGRPEHFENEAQHSTSFALKDAEGKSILNSFERYFLSRFSSEDIENYIVQYEATHLAQVPVRTSVIPPDLEEKQVDQASRASEIATVYAKVIQEHSATALSDHEKMLACEVALNCDLASYGDVHHKLISSYTALSDAHKILGDTHKSLLYQQKAVDVSVKVYRGNHASVPANYDAHLKEKMIAEEYKRLGYAHIAVRDLAAARHSFKQARTIYQQLRLKQDVYEIQEALNKTSLIYTQLRALPGLMRLLDNPFLLSLVLEAFPRLQLNRSNKQNAQQVTRADIYQAFADTWFTSITAHGLATLNETLQTCYTFSEALAFALFKAKTINITSQTSIWQNFFMSLDQSLARQSCPLRRKGTEYSFIHKSVYEYFAARSLWNALSQPISSEHPWKSRLLTEDRAIIDFVVDFSKTAGFIIDLHDLEDNMAEPAEHKLEHKHDATQQSQLLRMVKASKNRPELSVAAANAMTLLNYTRSSFSHLQLNETYISDADLSNAICDRTNFQAAHVERVNFTNAWLRHAQFQKAHVQDVQFAEYPTGKFTQAVTTCCYAKDAHHVVVAAGKDIYLYDPVNHQEPSKFKAGHTETVTSTALSADGMYVASASYDKTLRLWEIKNRASTILKWNIDQDGHQHEVSSVAFSPDSTLLAFGTKSNAINNLLQVWHINSNTRVQTMIGHTEWVLNIAFSEDGRYIASGSKDKTLRVWNIGNGRCEQLFQHTAWVISVAFSPDGTRLASGSRDKTMRLWNKASGLLERSLEAHTDWVLCVAFSPDGARLASGGNDKKLCVWLVESGQYERSLDGRAAVTSLAFSPDGVRLISGSEDKTLRLWDVKSSAAEHNLDHTDVIKSIAFSPDGNRLASAGHDHIVCIWNMISGSCEQRLRGHAHALQQVVFNHTGDHLASSDAMGKICIWNTSNGICEQILEGHTSKVFGMTFSHNGQYLFSSNSDMTLEWDLKSGQSKNLRRNRDWTKVAFSHSKDIYVSYVKSTRLGLWRINKNGSEWGDETRNLSMGLGLKKAETGEGHTAAVTCLAFNQDATRIASGSEDHTLRLWNAENGKCVKTLKGHTNVVTTIAFNRDGQYLFSGSADHTLRLWDVKLGKNLAGLKLTSVASTCDWHPTKALALVTGHEDAGVRYWYFFPTEKDSPAYLQLIWSSRQKVLDVADSNFAQSQGLSSVASNPYLLDERGAIGIDLEQQKKTSRKKFFSIADHDDGAGPEPEPVSTYATAQLLSQQGVSNQGVKQAQQHLGQAVLALLFAIEGQRQPEWDVQDHAKFTAIIVGALAQEEFDHLCADPEHYDLPIKLAMFIQGYIVKHPELLDLNKHLSFARCLKGMLFLGNIDTLCQHFGGSDSADGASAAGEPTAFGELALL